MSAPTPERVPPLTELYVYLAGGCNLNCRHCWIDPVFEQTSERLLPWPTLEQIVLQARPLGLQRAKLTGGEPFLHPEMPRILRGLSGHGLTLRLETNGTLVGEAEARLLQEVGAQVSVSIDGPDGPIHDAQRGVRGSFDRALGGARELRRAGVPFQVIIALTRTNLATLPRMLDLCRELGARSLKVNPVVPIARSRRMERRGQLLAVEEVLEAHRALGEAAAGYPELWVDFDVPPAFRSLQSLRKNGPGSCGILSILGVLHTGRGALCGIGEHEKALDFGDLLELGVETVWRENPVLQALRRGIPAELQGVCGRCMLRGYCQGKCVANTYMARGELLAGYPFCQDALERGLFPMTRLIGPDAES